LVTAAEKASPECCEDPSRPMAGNKGVQRKGTQAYAKENENRQNVSTWKSRRIRLPIVHFQFTTIDGHRPAVSY
jgi:hypothetical protein